MTDKPWLMWRADLEAAGIPYRDDAGPYSDLHALRHMFATELGRSGSSDKAVQQLMRHADARLTARYMHANRFDELQALSALPVPSVASSERHRIAALTPRAAGAGGAGGAGGSAPAVVGAA